MSTAVSPKRVHFDSSVAADDEDAIPTAAEYWAAMRDEFYERYVSAANDNKALSSQMDGGEDGFGQARGKRSQNTRQQQDSQSEQLERAPQQGSEPPRQVADDRGPRDLQGLQDDYAVDGPLIDANEQLQAKPFASTSEFAAVSAAAFASVGIHVDDDRPTARKVPPASFFGAGPPVAFGQGGGGGGGGGGSSSGRSGGGSGGEREHRAPGSSRPLAGTPIGASPYNSSHPSSGSHARPPSMAPAYGVRGSASGVPMGMPAHTDYAVRNYARQVTGVASESSSLVPVRGSPRNGQSEPPQRLHTQQQQTLPQQRQTKQQERRQQRPPPHVSRPQPSTGREVGSGSGQTNGGGGRGGDRWDEERGRRGGGGGDRGGGGGEDWAQEKEPQVAYAAESPTATEYDDDWSAVEERAGEQGSARGGGGGGSGRGGQPSANTNPRGNWSQNSNNGNGSRNDSGNGNGNDNYNGDDGSGRGFVGDAFGAPLYDHVSPAQVEALRSRARAFNESRGNTGSSSPAGGSTSARTAVGGAGVGGGAGGAPPAAITTTATGAASNNARGEKAATRSASGRGPSDGYNNSDNDNYRAGSREGDVGGARRALNVGDLTPSHGSGGGGPVGSPATSQRSSQSYTSPPHSYASPVNNQGTRGPSTRRYSDEMAAVLESNEALRAQLSVVSARAAEAERQQADYADVLTAAHERIVQLTAALSVADEDRAAAIARAEEAESQAEAAAARVAAATVAAAAVAETVAAPSDAEVFAKRADHLSAVLQNSQRERSELEASLAAVKRERDGLRTRLAALTARCTELEDEVAVKTDQLAAVTTAHTAAVARVDELEVEVACAHRDRRALSTALVQASLAEKDKVAADVAVAASAGDVASARLRAAALLEENERLHAELNALKGQGSYSVRSKVTDEWEDDGDDDGTPVGGDRSIDNTNATDATVPASTTRPDSSKGPVEAPSTQPQPHPPASTSTPTTATAAAATVPVTNAATASGDAGDDDEGNDAAQAQQSTAHGEKSTEGTAPVAAPVAAVAAALGEHGDKLQSAFKSYV